MITDGIFQHAVERPDHLAILSNKKRITYSVLKEKLTAIAGRLRYIHHEGKELRVGLLLDNSESFLEVFLGAVHVGALAIPFDPKWKRAQLNQVLQFTKPDVLFSTEDLLSQIDLNHLHCPVFEAATWRPLKEGRKNLLQSCSEQKQVTELDDFYLGFTSGTTGLPKGFRRHHYSWTESFRVSNELFHLSATDRIMAPGPFVHSLSLYAACHALAIGATFVLVDRFEAEKVTSLIKKEQVTTLYVVPTMLEALLDQKEANLLHNIRLISSGDKVHEKTVKRVKSKWPHASLYEFYGTSETSFISFLDYQAPDVQVTSVGKPFPNVNLRIEAKKEAEIGALYVKSSMLFTGYDQNPEATQNVLKEGWYRTGDLAKVDQRGYLYLVGREKNRLISGGLNIYPEEIERELKTRLGIDRLAIIGLPDPYWGEKLILVLEEETSESNERLIEKMKTFLPAYQCPKEIHRLSPIPMTGSGKIARKQLKARFLSQLEVQS